MSDRVPLVLLPGIDGTDVLFEPLLRALLPRFEPIVVRYPAHGANGYDDLQPLVDAAVRARPSCHVLGWSFGGPLALRAARRFPDRVRGVVLVSSFVTAPVPWLRWTGPLLATPVIGAVRVARRLPVWLGRAADDPLRLAKARIWQQVPARALAARARAIRRVDARDDLRCCPCDVLYLAADDDRAVPKPNVDEIRQLRPDVRLATFPGCHYAFWNDAPAVAQVLTDFVGSQPASRELIAPLPGFGDALRPASAYPA